MSPNLFVEPHYHYGLAYQRLEERAGYSLLLGDQAYLKQNGNTFGLPGYGHGRVQFSVGNLLAGELHLRQGFSWGGSYEPYTLRPHVGIELYNLDLEANTHGLWRLQYAPMIGVGPQFTWQTCKILVQAKGGISLNNHYPATADYEVQGAYGANLFWDCPGGSWFVDLIKTASQTTVEAGAMVTLNPHDDLTLNYTQIREHQHLWFNKLSLGWRRWFDF